MWNMHKLQHNSWIHRNFYVKLWKIKNQKKLFMQLNIILHGYIREIRDKSHVCETTDVIILGVPAKYYMLGPFVINYGLR